MNQLTLALDWTPNTNHIGFFISKDLGFYQEEGIDLKILNPADDNYAFTPGKKLELDLADFAIAPFETVISLNNKAKLVQATAIYAILQEDLSSIATLSFSKITSPKLLDGRTYASYKARYEDHIVRQMIKNDGGKADLSITYPDKLGIWNTLLEGKADATWIFDNWEGVEAESKNLQLNKFAMNDYEIPYSYSPVVLTKRETLEAKRTSLVSFIKATKKGFMFAQKHPKESIRVLENYLTEYDLANMDLARSLALTIPFFGNSQHCGVMNAARVEAFLNWLVTHGLEDKRILSQSLYTNELFD